MFKYLLSSAFVLTSLVYADSEQHIASKEDDDFFSLFTDQSQARSKKNQIADNDAPMPQTRQTQQRPRMKKQNRTHFAVYGDFLYWQPFVSDSTWTAYQNATTADGKITNIDLDFSWDVGFRAGVKFKSVWETLSFDAVWTRFHASSTNSVENLFLNGQKNINLGYVVYDSYYASKVNDPFSGTVYKGSATYKILFDEFDVCMKKNYRLTKMYHLYPFMAVRGIVLNERIKRTFLNDASAGAYSTSNRKSNTYAVGIAAGLGNKLKFGKEFGMDFGAGIFTGYGNTNARSNDYYGNYSSVTDSFTMSKSSNGMKVMTDIMVNLNWMKSFYDNSLDLYVSAGYEFHYIFNTPDLMNGADFYNGLTNQSKNTGFQGLTIRAGIGF